MNTEAVPYTAIMSDVDGDYVYVAQDMGNGMYQVAKKYVDKGMSGDYYTQITGGELEEGDLVIAYPSTVQENGIITIKADDDSDENTDSKDAETKDEETEDSEDEE
jgi:hypothetical protein